jgi:hypothetical protein
MPVDIVRTDPIGLDETQLLDVVERVDAIGVLCCELCPAQDRLPTLFVVPSISSLAQHCRVRAKVASGAPGCRLLDRTLLV